MSELYPLKFKTIFKEKLWGGQKIKTILGKDFGDLENCGETWELSGVSGNISEVANGKHTGKAISDLVDEFKEELVGRSIFNSYGTEFPLLIKYIDAAEDLSVQVHPNDELAYARHNCPGKSEMWYVIQADDDASLINGFSKDTNKVEYLSYFQSGKIMELLHSEKVKDGDVYYLPAGRVHTIGKGLFIAEIQQTSDITYRIYDFNRTDKEGNKRELHTELALDALDYSMPKELRSEYTEKLNQSNPIVSTPYFTTNKVIADQNIRIDKTDLDCFKIYIGVGGSGRVAGETIQLGDVILIPAAIKSYQIEPEGKLELLETYIDI
ncbi:type I phosphomannose isomerase catalytic subunit [Ekhidna sp. To15]|uniref:type I phosphomannose isomerase catalytic subunit n=1 Tax=Ekhidna sp. To15 TaxID=3395267 RepID=UPI003F51F731